MIPRNQREVRRQYARERRALAVSYSEIANEWASPSGVWRFGALAWTGCSARGKRCVRRFGPTVGVKRRSMVWLARRV